MNVRADTRHNKPRSHRFAGRTARSALGLTVLFGQMYAANAMAGSPNADAARAARMSKSSTSAAVTGPSEPVQQAIAGGAGMVFRLTPRKDYPGGSYNTSIYTQADIQGQTVTLTGLPGRIYLELQLSDWGASPTGNGFLRLWETYVDAASYGSGGGSALLPAVEPCASGSGGTPECNSDFGLSSGAVCSDGRCRSAWVDKSRTDGVQFSVPCSFNIWDVGVAHNYFGVLEGEEEGFHCGLPDPGTPRYGGAFALDARLGAFGTYSISLRPPPEFTYASDDSWPDPIPMTVAAILPAIIEVPLNMPCTTSSDCADGIECTDDVCNSGICSNPALPVGAACGQQQPTGLCDQPDSCDGAGFCNARILPPNTVCRPSTGDCDPQEVCSGNSAQCPADVLQPSGTPCRPAAGLCDVADVCNGLSGACPDAVQANGAVCRAATLPCDIAETCNGVSPSCPVDAVRASGVLCRLGPGVCDVSEACDGTGKDCPPNAFRPNTFVCRASASACDAPETCTGTSATCPANLSYPDGTTCPGDANFCTQDWCRAGVCRSFDDCSCANEPPTCGDGCCAIGDEHAGTCAADCDDLSGVADLLACVSTTAYSPGNPCLTFDLDGDQKVTALDYRIFVPRHLGGP